MTEPGLKDSRRLGENNNPADPERSPNGSWRPRTDPDAVSVSSFPNMSVSNSRVELWGEGNDVEARKEPESESGPDELRKGWRKYAGLLLTLSASLFFSIGVLIVKILSEPEYNYDSYSSSFWRYAGVTLPAIPLLMYYECGNGLKKKDASVFDSVWPLNKSEKWWTVLGLLSRGILGGSSVILRYFALHYLTIGDTAVITYSTPVLVTIMAHFFLKERCGVIPVIVAITTFCGVCIITRPPFLTGDESFNTETLIGTGFAVGSLVCAALIVIITRKIRDVHYSFMTLVFGFLGCLQALILTQIFNTFLYPDTMDEIIYIIGLGALSFLGQMAIILALQFEQAGPVSLIRSCDVIFGFLLQFIFLGVAPDLLSSVGGIIVLTGVLVTGIRKGLSTLPPEDPRRQRYSCLLR